MPAFLKMPVFFLISAFFKSFVNSLIEKCSESIGNNFVLLILEIFFKICQPQIILSLLASKTFLLFLMKYIVGSRPAMPTIAEMVISNLILKGK